MRFLEMFINTRGTSQKGCFLSIIAVSEFYRCFLSVIEVFGSIIASSDLGFRRDVMLLIYKILSTRNCSIVVFLLNVSEWTKCVPPRTRCPPPPTYCGSQNLGRGKRADIRRCGSDATTLF